MSCCDVQIILEGMGRSLHTNYNAKFKCDALKVTLVMWYLQSRKYWCFFFHFDWNYPGTLWKSVSPTPDFYTTVTLAVMIFAAMKELYVILHLKFPNFSIRGDFLKYKYPCSVKCRFHSQICFLAATVVDISQLPC